MTRRGLYTHQATGAFVWTTVTRGWDKVNTSSTLPTSTR